MLINETDGVSDLQQGRAGVWLKYLGLALLLVGTSLWMKGSYIYLKAELGQYLINRAWQQSLVSGSQYKPWFWADTWPLARMEIPSQGITQIVLAGDSGQALAFGPGHTSVSAQPGADGVVVISGHRDTHFRFLQYLALDDTIIVQNWEGQHTVYRVSGMQVVNEDVLIAPNNNVRNLMLVTCWPFNGSGAKSKHRFIVHAQAIDKSL